MRISAVIIALNESENISDAIRSLEQFADEVLLVDSGSVDETVAIAEDLGARVIRREFKGFSDQKQFAVDTASEDWVFSIDADERVSPELAQEIAELKGSGRPAADAFRVKRLNHYMGRPLRHGGNYPDRQLRLFDRRKARWNGRVIHEAVEVDEGARVSDLEGDLLHFSIPDPVYHHRMIGERYAPLSATRMFESGRRTTAMKIATVGLTTFLHRYVIKLGFLDGLAGFCSARFAAHHDFLKHLILRNLSESPRKNVGNTTDSQGDSSNEAIKNSGRIKV